MQKTVILIGLFILAVGVAWPWLGKLPLGRLPGDILIERPNMKFYFPVTTSILVSVVLSVLLWLFRK
ncbi:MAG TPA: DUF2905 domain-containing protein [Desulfomicrobiaceae bacterium]|nr:DUF2905 domain-containing protein [Desulfomicrobiaceae bacterium]